jgi:3-oxoadipate enol-lactonase
MDDDARAMAERRGRDDVDMSESLALPDGARLAFDDVGAAERGESPIVFLHAFPLHRAMWSAQVGALSSNRRCIVPDLRGFGDSTLGSATVTIDQMANDVIALLDHLHVDRAIVVGLSMGGYVAFGMLRKEPARISALALADTRAAADSDEARAKREELIEVARAQGSAAVAEKQLTGLLGKTTRERNTGLVDSLRPILASASVESLVAAIGALRDRPDSTPLLPHIDVPTLLICGEEDAVTQAKEMREVAAAVPGARFALIPGAGHLSNVEKPSEFNRALWGFLTENE